jgi:hypothetical protein
VTGSTSSPAVTPATPALAPAAPARPPPPPPSSMPEAQLVTSELQAAAAVAELLRAGEVAMDCEGELRRDGSVSLIQLYAPASAAAPASPCFVFDLGGMQRTEREAVLARLQGLLESPDVVKASDVAGLSAGLCAVKLQCGKCCPLHNSVPSMHLANRCCTTAGPTARRSSTSTASAAPLCGTPRCRS